MMSVYRTKILEIKKNGPVDIIKITFKGKDISLKVVDDSNETISLLTEWRKKSKDMFATNFKMSNNRTKNWIQQNILKNPDCILFMIYVNNKKVGNVAVDLFNEKLNSVELDNYMKDPTYDFPGMMTVVDKVFLKWIFEELKISKITTKIFADNYKMLNIHIRCGGWNITNVIPFKMINTIDGWTWKETKLQSNEFAERYMNVLEVKYEKLMETFGQIDYDFIKID
jgi:RimJ/RimL family protein N-acetyltransferase